MHRMSRAISICICTAAWGLLCAAVVATPLCAAHSNHKVASILYLLFSGICHQIPERSFALLGYPFPVCHRCFGIYAGLFLGCFFAYGLSSRILPARRFLILSVLAAMGFDVLAPVVGLWNNSAISRFSTGLAFGIMTSLLVVRGLAEFAQEFSWRRLVLRPAQLKGDLL